MSTPAQLRIAARIHFILKHSLGEGIDVSAMLRDAHEAREVLWVCQASGNAELVSLARQFVTAGKLAAPQARADAPQDAAWARNTSGFGVTQPAELQPAEQEGGWRSAAQWLRRGTSAR